MDNNNYVVAEELRKIADLLDHLNRNLDGSGIHVTQFNIGDSNGETLGMIDYRDAGYVYQPTLFLEYQLDGE